MKFLLVFVIFFSLAQPLYAHEVYVLDDHEITFAMAQKPLDVMDIIKNHETQFMLAVVLGSILIIAVVLFSISQKIESHLNKYLMKIKSWAPIIAQITLAVSLIASSYYGAIFGVELPFIKAFGSFSEFIRILVGIIGAMLLLGFYTRFASISVIVIFLILFLEYGFYMSNYLIYFGEALIIILFGSSYHIFKKTDDLLPQHHKYKFLIMRIFFGISLVYAAIYAKYLHGVLALETVMKYNLTSYFYVDALFLVVGALLIEIFIGLCFFFGFEIRFISIFFLVFLVMSLFFFEESVWPHFVLIGTTLSVFAHGYDKYTITGRFWRGENLEPVL